jgi:hypothetical protein
MNDMSKKGRGIEGKQDSEVAGNEAIYWSPVPAGFWG